MKNVYKITYDLKVFGDWMMPNHDTGWASNYVLANGDAKKAIEKLEKKLLKETLEGENGKKERVQEVRVIKVEQIARDVMV